MNNAGIHASINFFRYGYGDPRRGNYVDYYDLLFNGGSRLAGLTAVGDVNMLGWIDDINNRVPGIIIVARMTVLEQHIMNNWGVADPEDLAFWWATNIDSILKTSPLDQHTRYIYWQPVDERKLFYDWHVKFDLAAMQHMMTLGRRYAALNLFTGCPEQNIMGDSVDGLSALWPIFVESAKYPDSVLLQTHAYIETEKPLTDEQMFHALRPISWIDRARREGLKIKMVIGETGCYNKFPESGIRDFAHYASILEWMWDQYQPYSEVVAINTYTNDTNGPDGNDYWFVPPEVIQRTRTYNIEKAGVVVPPPPTGYPYSAVLTRGLNARVGTSDSGTFVKFLPAGTPVTVIRDAGSRVVITTPEIEISVLEDGVKRV